jgi:hypothetical protein
LKASGLMSARRGRSTITFTMLCLLPVGAADPAAVFEARDASRRRT